MIKIKKSLFRELTSSERLVMIHLLLDANVDGETEFSDRKVSRETGVPYQQVRTIHKRFLDKEVINAAGNALPTHATICKINCYDDCQRDINADANAELGKIKKENCALKKEIDKLNKQIKEKNNINNIREPNGSIDVEKEEETKVSPKKEKAKRFDVWDDLSYVDENHYAMWYDWLRYKDEIKKQYSTQMGAKKAYTHWLNLSNGDFDKARSIIDQSIMRNWDGLFDVRDYKPKEETKPAYDNPPQQRKWQT